ncbi:hypothetical protein KX729_24995 [Rhizobium sp. XQZ8]|uniref:hypothetical protein n=1 Tax=Rhizobium populisoli TaxID=2859785 RepID=UPI001CA5BB35|nr:hypothetical protein [Rhizobium populisoli]MBW6424715.1 hypothetical protein [Rhizobium populisoli]
MLRRVVSIAIILLAALPLMAFRMPAASESGEKMLYDVRGAFVTARPDVPQGLVIQIDLLMDVAIRSTVRQKLLPRAILSVRIEETSHTPLMIGSRHAAKVTVKAISVSSGEPIAEGTFRTSVFLLNGEEADKGLAEKVADRISSEFRLLDGRPTIASALFP